MPDTGYPNVFTVAPDGGITADFTGHIHAQGLDLDAGSDPNPAADHRVRWLRASDGAVLAQLLAYPNALSLEAQAPAFGEASSAQLVARTDTGAPGALLNVRTDTSPLTSAVEAFADPYGGLVLTVVDQDGASSFPQLPIPGRVLIDGPYFQGITALAAGADTTLGPFSLAAPYGSWGIVQGAFTGGDGHLCQWRYDWLDASTFEVIVHNASFAPATTIFGCTAIHDA